MGFRVSWGEGNGVEGLESEGLEDLGARDSQGLEDLQGLDLRLRGQTI